MSRTPTSAPTPGEGKSINGTRWSPLKAPEKQTIEQVTKLGESLSQAFPLKQELPLIYELQDLTFAPAPDSCLTWVLRSRLHPSVTLAPTIRRHRDWVRAAIRFRSEQRAAGRPQQPHPPNQLPQLRPPLSLN